MNRVIIILVVLMVASIANAQDIGCGISVIPQDLIELGCSCGYRIDDESKYMPIFKSWLGWIDPEMYIDGKLVQVTPSKLEVIPATPKLGDKFTQKFIFEGREVIFDNVISFVCPPENEFCENTGFDSSIRIDGNQCSVEIKGYKGFCGC